ncbi:protein-L-isoaspartate O-methyltransferase [Streptacidiphilus sp. EB103A]|uniref:protein-L-isoaspartate O-methyltransferase family protein n=1 Tax=Streptacidiphilus sp. EB103A TaxID=3156275 RepID=UPI003516BC53
MPRHVFVPNWWARGAELWDRCEGRADPVAWMKAAYGNCSLVTRVGPLHADQAAAGYQAAGLPTSSSTMPGLVVRMFQHAMLTDNARTLCVTGSGYGTALLSRRLGEKNVTSVDIDPYLVDPARHRLEGLSIRPFMNVCDITGPLPGTYDRIVSTVSVPRVPASWLEALKTGGRLVTTIADTGIVLTADKTDDGGATGGVGWDRASFMATRDGGDYPPALHELFEIAGERDGEDITQSPYPVLEVCEAWDVWSMLSLAVPGIEHRYRADGETRTAWMAHPDGSWARATSSTLRGTALVHQAGSRRLWDELDRIRRRWLAEGGLPIHGARVDITPDGTTTFTRGKWCAVLA